MTPRAGKSSAVFLDRDGVLIRSLVRGGIPHPPRSLEEFEILPGVPAALERLARHGFLLMVVTNQPDVSRGTQSREVIELLNARLGRDLPRLTEICVCFHDAPDACSCRKPAPGMLLQAAERYCIDLRASWMVGDRWSDVAAGKAAGCRTLLIERDYSEANRCTPDGKVADLEEAARRIVSGQENQT